MLFSFSAPLIKAQDSVKLLEGVKLLNDGQQLVASGKPKSIHLGIEKYQQAAALFHSEGVPHGETAALTAIGMAYSTLEEWDNAIKYLNQSIPLAHSLNEPVLEGTALAVLAFTYTSANQYKKAIPSYEQALLILQNQNDNQQRTLKGVVLSGLGMNYIQTGEHKKAFEYLEQALALKRELKDPAGEAQVLTVMGAASLQLGQSSKALDYDQRALALAQSLNDKHAEALAAGVLGGVYRDLGQNDQALEYFNQELSYRKSVDDQRSISSSLNHIAGVYSNMNDMANAFSYYNQALQINRDTSTLNNLGQLYGSTGEFQRALEFYSEALTIAREEFDRRAEAAALSNIGSFYFALGEPGKALDYYTQALPLMQAMSSPSGEASILRLIGGVLSGAGRHQEALAKFARALELTKSADRFGEVGALINIGGMHSELKEDEKAINYFNQALPIAMEINDRVAVATISNNMGAIYRRRGENRKALDAYDQALKIVRDIGDREKEVSTLGNIAKAQSEMGDLKAARSSIESALDMLESLRTKVGREDLRASFLAKDYSYFEFEIDLLMKLHKLSPAERLDVLALQTSERARARSLSELLIESRANIRQGVDPELLTRERSLQQQINAKAFARMRLSRIPNTEGQSAALAKETEALINELQQVKAQIRQKNPEYAALTQFRPLSASIMQAHLDADTLLLEYSLGEERSYLWLVSPTEIKSFVLPPRKEVENATQIFLEVLKSETPIYSVSQQPGSPKGTELQRQESLENAVALSRMLLGPIGTQLSEKRLMFVGDGILQALPFAALPDPIYAKGTSDIRPLIWKHEIVSLPSISILETLRDKPAARKSPPKDLIVLADPVFYANDDRIKSQPSKVKANSIISTVEMVARETGATRDGERLARLTYSRTEAEAITGFLPGDRVKKALDFDANRALVNSGELSQYRYVHFATHGLLDSKHPELTSIVLSLVDQNGNPEDGFFRAHEVYNLNLRADLVVLSACETGLGKEVRGEGLIGLTRGFMYAGAPRVMVSLWSVKDESTSQLMSNFYRGMLKEGKRASEALRAAQLEMLKQPRWQAPHYWAPFVLQGEWR